MYSFGVIVFIIKFIKNIKIAGFFKGILYTIVQLIIYLPIAIFGFIAIVFVISIFADTSYSTIGNGEFKTNDKIIPVPKWVKPFLEHYEKSVKYDYLKNEIFEVMKDLEKKN